MKKIIYLVIFLAFTLFSYKYFQSHIFTLHFVDEDENIIAGYYMGKGEKLYKDIFSHKQPLPAVISSGIQKITKPNSLYLLVKRHREFIYFYSFIFSILLIIFFGFSGLIFSMMIEIIKPFLLGNQYLAESLTVFPLVFVFGYLWKIFQNELPNNKLETKILKIFFFLSLSLLVFFMFILLPLVFLLLIFLVAIKKINVKNILLFVFFFSFLFLICSAFVSYPSYWDNTLNAIKYLYLGGSGNDGLWKMLYYAFLKPVVIFSEMKKSDFGAFLGVNTIVYILSFIYLFIKQKKMRLPLVIIYCFLSLASLRLVYPSKTFYEGFHQLPWFGTLLFITIYQIIYALHVSHFALNHKTKNFAFYIVILLFAFCFLNYSKFLIKDYYRPSNRETDWYVNYSRFYDFGQTIKTLSEKGDKLMVLPAEQLIYWQSGLPHASRFLYVYPLVIPKYKKELINYWEETPPAFLYNEQDMNLFQKWWPDYVRVKKEKSKEDTPLFIRRDKIKSLKDWQLNEIKQLNFFVK